MYSFAPSRIYAGLHEGFPRPTLPKSDYVNPSHSRIFKIARKVPPDEILRYWNSVRSVLQRLGIVEGVHFTEPGPNAKRFKVPEDQEE